MATPASDPRGLRPQPTDWDSLLLFTASGPHVSYGFTVSQWLGSMPEKRLSSLNLSLYFSFSGEGRTSIRCKIRGRTWMCLPIMVEFFVLNSHVARPKLYPCNQRVPRFMLIQSPSVPQLVDPKTTFSFTTTTRNFEPASQLNMRTLAFPKKKNKP